MSIWSYNRDNIFVLPSLPSFLPSFSFSSLLCLHFSPPICPCLAVNLSVLIPLSCTTQLSTEYGNIISVNIREVSHVKKADEIFPASRPPPSNVSGGGHAIIVLRLLRIHISTSLQLVEISLRFYQSTTTHRCRVYYRSQMCSPL